MKNRIRTLWAEVSAAVLVVLLLVGGALGFALPKPAQARAGAETTSTILLANAEDYRTYAAALNGGAEEVTLGGGTYRISDSQVILSGEIDLSGEFVGLGTSAHPFTGVFNGANHTVTVPEGTEYIFGTVANATVGGIKVSGTAGLIETVAGDVTILNGTISVSGALIGTIQQGATVTINDTASVITASSFAETNNGTVVIKKFSKITVTGEIPSGYFAVAAPNGVDHVVSESGEYTYSQVSGVAKIGATYYRTLQAAIDAASAGTTVVLVNNFAEDVTVAEGQNITLDLNGHTLTNAGGHTITNNGTLTVTGEGTVDNVTHGKAALYNNVSATAVLDGGVFTRSAEAGTPSGNGGNSYYVILNQGTLTVNNGVTVKANGGYSSLIENGWYNAAQNTTNATAALTINGGTFSGGVNTVKNDEYGVATITGGTFENTTQAVLLNWNKLTVEGGKFIGSDTVAAVVTGVWAPATSVGETVITGGTFTGSLSEVAGYSSGIDYEISGGTYSEIPNYTYFADGYVHEALSDGTYGVAGGTGEAARSYVAAIGTVGYETLASAISAARSGDTVKLITDIALSSTVTFEKDLVLDLNGKTVTNNKEGGRVFDVAANVSLTVNANGGAVVIPVTNTNSLGIFLLQDSCTLILNGGTYTGNTANGALFRPANYAYNQNVVLNNVTAETNYRFIGYGAIYDSKATFNVNGGTYTQNNRDVRSGGYSVPAFYLVYSTSYFEDVTITSEIGQCVEVVGGTATFKGNNVFTVLDENTVNPWNGTALSVSTGGTATVKDGVYQSQSANGYGAYVFNSSGTLTIEGGKFVGGTAALKADNSRNANIPTVTVKGGNFEGNVTMGSDVDISITGGTYSEALNASYISSSALVYAQEGGTYRVYTDAEAVSELHYTVKIGVTGYETLALAVEAVPADNTETTIVFLPAEGVVSGAGVVVSARQNIVIDFNGVTYNVTNPVGSAGTETNAFQLLKGSTVTMKNGAITASSSAQILIQNYCDLTLEDMILDESANTSISYVVSNNFGSLTVKGNTQIIAHAYRYAFDLYYWPSNGYAEGVTVTFGEDFTGKVKGYIHYGSDETDSGSWQDKAALTIENGTFDVTFSVYSAEANNANVAISGGTFTKLPNYNYFTEGFVHTQTTDSEGNTVYGVTAGSYVASIGAVGYVAFTDAFAAAESGDTIVLQANVALDAGLTVNKNLTIDLNGHTLTSAETAFVVDGAKLTVKDSSEAQNGAIKVTNDYGIFVKNGGTVVVNSGSVESKYAALSSNNTTGAGNFTVNGGKISADLGPAIYMPAMGTLTVTGGTVQGGIIARMGNIAISGGEIIAPTTNLDKIEEYYDYGGNAWFGGALTLLTGTYAFEGSNSLTVEVTGGTFVNNYTGTDKQFANAITVYVTGKTEQQIDVNVATSGVSYTVPTNGKNVVFTDVASVVGDSYKPAYAENVNLPEYNGAELPVIAGTTYYATLTDAITAAADGATVKLLADITDESDVIYVTKSLTIDLNGKTLTFTKGETKGLRIEQDSIEVTIKNGTITSNNRAIMLKKGKLSLVSVYAVNVGTELQTIDVQNDAELTVDANSVIENAHNGYAIVPYYSAVVNVYGTVKANGEAAISTNGSYSHDVTINVYPGAVITNNAACGIYLPTGTLNVYGGTITGTTGIEIRAGVLNVQGGEIIATANAFSVTANGNGSTVEGAAIAVSQHTTNLSISVTLNGGTYTGIYAVYEKDLQDGVAQSVTLSLTGGTYEGEVYSKDVKNFISGGTYTVRPKYVYFADAYYAHYDEASNTYSVAAGYFAALLGDYGYETFQAALEAAQSGDTIVILDDIMLEEGLTIVKNITLDLNGHTLTSAETAFVVDGATLTVKDGSEAKNGAIKVTNDYGILVKNGGTVVVNSGSVESKYAALSSNNTTGAGNFTVEGGKISADLGPAIYMPAMGTLTVTNGTVQGGIIARMGTIAISGGTIIAPTTNLDKIEEYYDYGGNAWFGGALTLLTGTYAFGGGNSLTANVTGGTFVNNYTGTDKQFANAITVYVTGKTSQFVHLQVGNAVTFNVANGKNVVFTDVASVVGDAYKPAYAMNVNLPEYNGAELPVIAGTTYYATVEDAVTAAQSGDTVKLLDDVTGRIRTDKNLTVDLNGHTLTSSSNIAVSIQSGANDVTLKNGTIKSVYTGASYSIVGVYNTAAENVTLDNVTIDLSSTETTIASSGRYPSSYGVHSMVVGTLTIKNSNVKVTCDVGQDEEGNKNAWYGYAVFVAYADALEISGTTIESNGYGIGIYGNYGTSAINTALENNEVLDNVTVTVTDSVIRSQVFCVANNGMYHGTVISITDSTLESELSAAIYHPGYGDLTINGTSTITGTTGIEMRAGNLTINDDTVTVTATASPAEVEANGGGSSMLGIAVAISQHTTNLPISVTLNGGKYTGYYSVYEEDLMDGVTEGVAISLTDGTYEGEIASENVDKFISGGTYSKLPKYEYLADTFYAPYDSATNTYIVTNGTFAAKTGEYGYETLAAAINAAADGATVTLLTDVAEDITVAAEKNITLDLNGKTLTSTGSRKATLTNYGTLWVKDSVSTGKITRDSSSRSAWFYTIVNEGNLTLEGIKVENTTDDYSSLIINNKDCRAENAATLTIKSGTYVSGGSNAVKNDEYGKLVIEGGTFTTTANGNYAAVMTWGVATVSGGEFVGENGNIALTVAAYNHETNTTTIRGGKFTSDSAAVYVKNGDGGNDGGTINLDLVGGVYEGKIYLLDNEEFPSAGVTIDVTGGEYTVAPHWSFFNDAYSLGAVNAQGRYTVANVAYVAVVRDTDTAYTTLAAAVAAAEALEGTPVIALLRDNAEAVALNDVALDLAGYEITGTVTLNSGNAKVIAPAGNTSYFNAVIKGANGCLVAYYDTAENRVYTLADIYLSGVELFLNGHAAVITAQDGANPESDTNLFVSYTVDGVDYVALYNSTTAARVFGGWKYPDLSYGIDTTNESTSITLNSGKVDSLRGSSKDQNKVSSINSACKMNTATIVVNGGSVGIVAAGWYYNQSMEAFNVTVNGGNVGTIYGNGETASTAAAGMPAGYVPTVKLANITVTGGTVGFVYGSGRAVTTAATSANYSMVTEKAVINVTGGNVTCVNGGGFNGPEDNWGETSGQDTVIVNEAVITVSGGNVANVFGGGYNGQWKFTHKINADGELVFSNWNGTDETQTVRNIVEKSTVNVEDGANITNLYLGGRSYAYVENVKANVTGGNIGTMSMSGNYGHVESSNATVSGGVIDKLELVTRNYVENINLSVLGGAHVNAFYAGVGGAYKNSNCNEQTYNLSTTALLGNVNVSAAEGTVTNGYLTTGLERAQEVTVTGIDLALTEINLVADSGYTGTLTKSGDFAAKSDSVWNAVIVVKNASSDNNAVLTGVDANGKTIRFTPPAGNYLKAVSSVENGYVLADIVATVTNTEGVVTHFDSLQAAINAATDGATVKLFSNVTENITVAAEKNITLDLNGKTITNAGDHTITNYGTLTITGAGMVDNVTHGKAAVYNKVGATAVLNGGTFTRSGETGTSSGNSYYVILNQGAMEINAGVKVEAIGGHSSLIENGWYNPAQNTTGAASVLTIRGGTFVGGKYTVKNDDYGTTTITGGTFSEAAQYAVLNWNALEISGGKFSGTVGAVYTNVAVDAEGNTESYENGSTVITGGEFTGEIAAAADATTAISGGIYSEIPNYTYFASGKVHEDLGNGTYGVKNGSYVASIGAVGYVAFTDAFATAESGDTIVLQANVALDAGLTVTKNITIDLNGKTITSAETAFFVDGAKLTVKDGATNGTIKVTNDYGIFVKNGGTVVVNSGSVESLYAAFSSNNTTGEGNFTVNGGKIAAQQGPAIYMPAMGTLTVTNGTVQGGIIARMGNIEISGGTIIAPTENLDKIEEYYDYGGNAWFGGALTLLTGTYTFEGGNSLTVDITGGRFVNEYAGTEKQFANAITVYVTGKTAQEINVNVAESGVSYTVPTNGKNVVFTDVASVVGDSYKPAYAENVNLPEYNGAELPVIAGTTYYATLSEAIAAATDGATVTVLDDLSLDSQITIDKNLTLDLGGHTISSTAYTAFRVNNVNVTVQNGSINATGEAFRAVGGEGAAVNTLTLKENLNVVSETDCSVYIYGSIKLVTSANLTSKGDYATIQGNGANAGYTDITINGGSIISEISTAIYQPQYNGKLTVNDGTIKGTTGIEIRGGELTINGGTVIATATTFEEVANGSGSTITGAAVAVSQHTTNKPTKLTVNGGTLTGIYAVYEKDLQDEVITGISLSLTGGTYEGDVASENVEKFISGGIYSEIPNYTYFVSGKVHNDLGNGTYGVKNGNYVATIGTVGYETLQAAIEAAGTSGATITLIANVTAASPDGNPFMNSIVNAKFTLDLNGFTLDSSVGQKIIVFNNVEATIKNGSVSANLYNAYGPYTDGGTVTLQNVTASGAIVNNYGTMTLDNVICTNESYNHSTVNGGTVTVTGENTRFDGAINVNGGELHIENGTFANVGTTAGKLTITGGTFGNAESSDSALTASNTELTITGGTFLSKNQSGATVALTNGTTAQISGATVSNASESETAYGISVNASTVTVDGGVYGDVGSYGNANLTIRSGSFGRVTAYGSSEVAIEDGTFTGELAANNAATISATGGTYAVRPKYVYVGDGYFAHYNEADTTYTVSEGSFAAVTGDYGYETLQAAINAAENGATVKVLSNVTENVTVAADRNIVLDLGGKTITNAGGHTITNYGTLTITGAGTVDNVTHARGALVNYGTAILRGGVFTRSAEAGTATGNGGNSWYVIDNQGEMQIYVGTTVTSTSGYSSMIRNADVDHAATLTVYGGELSGGLNTIKNGEYGTIVIEGGRFTNSTQAVLLNWNNLTVEGGEFIGSDTVASVMTGYYSENAVGNTQITDGNFKGALAGFNGYSEEIEYHVTGGTFESAGELLNSYAIPVEWAVYYTTNPAVTTVSALASVPSNAFLVGGRSANGFTGYAIDSAYIAFELENETIIITAEDFARRALEEVISHKDSLLATYLYSENGKAQLESIVENAAAVMEGFAAVDRFDDIMKTYNTAIRDLNAVLTVNEEADSLADAVADAKADVRLYAAVLGVALPVDIYAGIDSAVNVSQVKTAKLAAMDRLDQILADAVAALEAAKAAAIAEIQAAAAETSEGAGDAVVVPTATYAAINNAASLDEVAFYKTNALAEINDVRTYRAQLYALISGDGETLLAAIQALSNALLDTVDGNGEPVLGKLSQLQIAIETKIGDAQTAINEATSDELETLYGDLTDYLDTALATLKGELLGAISGLSTQITEVKGAVDTLTRLVGSNQTTLLEKIAEAKAAADGATAAVEELSGALLDTEGEDGIIKGKLTQVLDAVADAKAAAEKVTTDLTTVINTAIGTVNTKIATLTEQISQYNAQLTAVGEKVSQILVDLGGAKSEILNALSGLNGAITNPDGAMAENTQAILDKIAEAQDKIDSIGETVSTIVVVEESKEDAKQELQTWINAYVDNILNPAAGGDTAERGVQTFAAVVTGRTVKAFADVPADLESKIRQAFSATNAELVIKYYKEAIDAINAATTTQEISNALSTFKTQVATVEVIDSLKPADNTGLYVLLVIIAVAVIAAVVILILLLLKKKNAPAPVAEEVSDEKKTVEPEQASAEPEEEPAAATTEEVAAQPEEVPAEETAQEETEETEEEPAGEEDETDEEEDEEEGGAEAETAIALSEEEVAELIKRYNFSYAARLVLADPILQVASGTLTDEILAYKGVKVRESWKQKRFNKGRKTVACLLFKGKKLCLALALDPVRFADTKYRVTNVSEVKRFAQTPTLIKLTSARKMKYAKELIALMMEELGAPRMEGVGPEEDATKYLLRRESPEKLVSRGLARTYEVDASATEFFNKSKD